MQAKLVRRALEMALIAAGMYPLSAAGSEYLGFDYPEASMTIAIGINEPGDIVGFYIDEAEEQHGFLLRHGKEFTKLDFPDAVSTSAFDINDQGEIVGSYVADDGQEHAFLRTKQGTWLNIDFPDPFVCQALALGINSRGDIVGYYDVSNDGGGTDGPDLAFVRHPDGTFETISNDLSDDSLNVWDLNPRGEMIGAVTDSPSWPQGELGCLIQRDGTTIVVQVPFAGAVDTIPTGISPQGIISGFYLYENLDTFGPGHGFVRDRAGNYTDVRYPGAVKTLVGKINASGWFVGAYYGEDGIFHGFLARR